jgi:hypothetical protein
VEHCGVNGWLIVKTDATMTDDEFAARYEKAEARWLVLCGIDPKLVDYDPHLAFAEYFDDVAGLDLETVESFLDEWEAEGATKH